MQCVAFSRLRSVLRVVVFFALAVLVASPGHAAADGNRRVALVIGNSHYSNLEPLPNPANDVREVAEVLRKAGFAVTLGLDVDQVGLEETVRAFLRSAEGAHVGLVYYAGHGVQIGGRNFLVPVDATLDSAYDVETQTMPLELIIGHLREKSRVQLVFLDACRNNPFKNQSFWMAEKLEPVGPTRGLAPIESDLGSLIAFSTAPGEVALDGAGKLSPYTQYFVDHASVPNKEIRQVLTEVRRDVITATKGAQVPWENSSLIDSFYFFDAPKPPILAALQQQTVPAGAGSTPLSLEQPKAPSGSPLTVSVLQVPQAGRVLLAGAPLAAAATLKPDDLAKVTFDASGVQPGTVALFGYAAADTYGQSAQSVVAIQVVQDAGQQRAEEERRRREAEEAVAAYLASLDGQSRSAIIGIGPQTLALAAPSGGAVEAAYTVAGVPAEGVLRVGDRTVTAGNVLKGGELPGLTFDPAVGSEGRAFELALEAAPGTRAVLPIDVALDPCDLEAGAPLDLQGVAPGLLPNEIEPESALAACTAAVEAHPAVPRFVYQLGRAQLAGRDAERAAASFTKAMEAGHVRAAYNLAALYARGALGAPDQKKAMDLWLVAADKGDPYGLHDYGKRIYRGASGEEDRKRGMDYLLRAAELGHTYAMNELGAIFMDGIGVTADPERAVRYYQGGVARKDIFSINNLAVAYRSGKGVPKDEAKALDLFKQASDGGHPYAPRSIARMYRDGIGVSADPAEAAKWFELAAERGDYWAAHDRAKLALDTGEAKGDLIATRYFAMAVGLSQISPDPKQNALKALVKMPSAAKKSVEKSLIAILDKRTVKDILAVKDINERLGLLSGLAWKSRNPRYDLI